MAKKYKVKKKPQTKAKKPTKRRPAKKPVKSEILDPRWAEFLANFIDPQSETIGNGLQSALRAGFSDGVARQIRSRMPVAVLEKVRQTQRLKKAEQHLDKVLDMNEVEPMISMFGPVFKKDANGKKTAETYMRVNTHVLKVKTDVAKFLAETIGKATYSKQINTVGLFVHKVVLNDEQLRKLDGIRAERSPGENLG